jgi:hypothetical protein
MAVITKTLKPSGGDYSLMSTWESTEQTNLVAAGDTHVLECYTFSGGLAESAGVTVDGWTTGASNYITIKAASGSENFGVQQAGFYMTNGAAFSGTLALNQAYTRLQDIEIRNTRNSFSNTALTLSGSSDYCLVERCIAVTTTGSGVAFVCAIIDDAIIRNNLFLTDGTGGGRSATWDNRTNNALVDNNTFYSKSTNSLGWASTADATPSIFRNNVFIGAVVNAGPTSHDAATTNNAFSSTGNFGASQVTGVVTTDGVDFVAPSTNDYTPVSGGALEGAGTDLSGTFIDDITGATRDSTWDIGAYAYIAAGGTGGIRNPLGGPLTLRSPLGI